jgi:hypothetical protein
VRPENPKDVHDHTYGEWKGILDAFEKPANDVADLVIRTVVDHWSSDVSTFVDLLMTKLGNPCVVAFFVCILIKETGVVRQKLRASTLCLTLMALLVVVDTNSWDILFDNHPEMIGSNSDKWRDAHTYWLEGYDVTDEACGDYGKGIESIFNEFESRKEDNRKEDKRSLESIINKKGQEQRIIPREHERTLFNRGVCYLDSSD